MRATAWLLGVALLLWVGWSFTGPMAEDSGAQDDEELPLPAEALYPGCVDAQTTPATVLTVAEADFTLGY
jgi:hypothetical protein